MWMTAEPHFASHAPRIVAPPLARNTIKPFGGVE